MKRKIKILCCWTVPLTLIGICFMILAAGGNGASVGFFTLGFFGGITFGVIHCFIITFKSWSSLEKKWALSVGILILAGVILKTMLPPECRYSEAQAIAGVLNNIKNTRRNPDNLSAPTFDRGSCTYSFIYKGDGEDFGYVFEQDGNVYLWDYVR